MTLELLHPDHRRAVLTVCTDRQVEVLNLVTLGYSDRAIARRLNLHRTTVREHIDSALARIDRSVPDLAAALRASAG